MAPRRQWESNAGYCGEVSTISALLYYGGYMSQYDMRVAASPTSRNIQTTTEYLLGVNDQKCATNVKLASQKWNSINGNVTEFIAWVKRHIQAGRPVTIAVYMNQYAFYGSTSLSAGDSDYDHIVPVLKVDSNYNDGLYHPDDIIYFSDNGSSACIKATD